MFDKFYDRKRTPAQEPTPAYVVRDRGTRQIIASGDRDKCLAYASAFGLCYVEEAQ